MKEITDILTKLWNSPRMADLGLMLLGAGNGFAVIKFLDYPLEWNFLYFIVILLIVLTFGGALLDSLSDRNNRDILYRNGIGVNAIIFLTFLLFGLSIAPLYQVIHLTSGSSFFILLVSVTISLILLREFLNKTILIYGLNELLVSFMASSLMPLLVVANQFAKIPNVLYSVSAFNLFAIFSSQLLKKFLNNTDRNQQFDKRNYFIGLYSIQKMILALFSTGYIFSFFIIYSLKLDFELFLPILFSFPATAYILANLLKLKRQEDSLPLKMSANYLGVIVNIFWFVVLWCY